LEKLFDYELFDLKIDLVDVFENRFDSKIVSNQERLNIKGYIEEVMKHISVYDLFAGPGGLGEGFASYRDTESHTPFKIKLSIEKDPSAHRTLTTRALYRKLSNGFYPEIADTC